MMKLFVIAALVAVAAAGRLEHLERSYIPPESAAPTFSSHGGFNSFDGANSGTFGTSGLGLNNQYIGATSNQYLPPDHGHSASSQFAGSLTGFGQSAQNYPTQYSGVQTAPAQQYVIPSTQYGVPEVQNQQVQYSQQSAAVNRQYLAPRPSSIQNPPQQAFDDRTGYHY